MRVMVVFLFCKRCVSLASQNFTYNTHVTMVGIDCAGNKNKNGLNRFQKQYSGRGASLTHTEYWKVDISRLSTNAVFFLCDRQLSQMPSSYILQSYFRLRGKQISWKIKSQFSSYKPFSTRELGCFYRAKRANTSGKEEAASDSSKYQLQVRSAKSYVSSPSNYQGPSSYSSKRANGVTLNNRYRYR